MLPKGNINKSLCFGLGLFKVPKPEGNSLLFIVPLKAVNLPFFTLTFIDFSKLWGVRFNFHTYEDNLK